jgi:N-methylhydantoinase A/oxoprolinase/acetone carboxylase beta subunit
MGALSLCSDIGDAILLDIGGTTTDIAVFADGVPLLEPYGATVDQRPTLIRALQTVSIGVGGDSCVTTDGLSFTIGPEKKGSPVAFGGQVPTPTDAMIVLGSIAAGSKESAAMAMKSLRPAQNPEKTAQQILTHFVADIHQAVEQMLDDIFSRPVYTVSDLLTREKVIPTQLVAIGGPALALQSDLSSCFGLSCHVPEDFEVANAIGAARARVTVQASLYADSNSGTMTIPEISCMERIDSSYTMQAAEARLAQEITAMARNMGMNNSLLVDIIEREEMNIVRGFSTSGKIISIKGQIRPGLRKKKEEI